MNVTDEMVTAAADVLYQAGFVEIPMARIRDHAREGMSDEERAAGIEAMGAEDRRAWAEWEASVRRALEAALEASSTNAKNGNARSTVTRDQ